MPNSAIIDATGTYRYRLERDVGPSSLVMTWVMMNPSTADAETDDHTIRRCMFYTRREGFGSMVVVNLFAYRATHPAELLRVPDPVGPDNHGVLVDEMLNADAVVVAYGIPDKRLRPMMPPVNVIATELDIHLSCLGKTRSGYPRHPSRLPDATALVPYP